jgi:secreted Zn-dependent insulinase-like peptidase
VNHSHLQITFEGYNDSLNAVHETFFAELQKFTEVRNETRFDSLLATLVKDKQNLEKGTPLSVAFDLQKQCLIDNHFGYEALIENVSKITFSEYTKFKKAWLDQATCDILIEGNISEADA